MKCSDIVIPLLIIIWSVSYMRRGFEVHKRNDGRWYARYRRTEKANGKAGYSYVYGQTKEEVEERLRELNSEGPELNLLILGAGTHGMDVKEIAESLHIFRNIKFLDDELESPDILGKCNDAHKYKDKFPCAFIAIGDNQIREKYAAYLKEHHFLIPSLVAPSAFISAHAKIGEGTVVMPQTNLGAVKVRDFCIVAAGSTIGSGVEIGSFARVDNGAIVPKGEDVPDGTWIRSGEIYKTQNMSVEDAI